MHSRSFSSSLGTRAFSHDSVFIPDGGAESEQTVQAMSQDSVLGKVKTLQVRSSRLDCQSYRRGPALGRGEVEKPLTWPRVMMGQPRAPSSSLAQFPGSLCPPARGTLSPWGPTLITTPLLCSQVVTLFLTGLDGDKLPGEAAELGWEGRAPNLAQRVKSPTSVHEDSGSIPCLAQWVKDPG